MESGYYKIKKKIERKRLIDKEVLKQAVHDKSDAYLRELVELFGCSRRAIFYALRNLVITYKKTFTYSEKNEHEVIKKIKRKL